MSDAAGIRTNWCGHVPFSATSLVEPASVADVQAAVAAADRVRPLGTGHSFNDIADTTGIQIGVAGLPATVEIDEARGVARVPGGVMPTMGGSSAERFTSRPS